jgi:hypothetical protein
MSLNELKTMPVFDKTRISMPVFGKTCPTQTQTMISFIPRQPPSEVKKFPIDIRPMVNG